MATPEELKKAAQKAAGSTVTEEVTETVKTPISNKDQINAMYDALNKAQKEQIDLGYKQTQSEMQAAKDKINPTYQGKANDLAVQYERNRRNFNQQAASRGLNTGAASQANLAQNNEYLRDYGNLRTAEAEAMTDADRSMAQLTEKYQGAIRQAAAENDYKRAAELMNDANNEFKRRLQRAQTLAQYGDFSGYKDIYGESEADGMEQAWTASHPELAYNTGRIDANKFYEITGRWPAGYTPPASGGGGYSGGGYGGGGSYDERVAAAQAQLKADGYDIAVDGIMGPATQAALAAAMEKQRREQYGLQGGRSPLSVPSQAIR